MMYHRYHCWHSENSQHNGGGGKAEEIGHVSAFFFLNSITVCLGVQIPHVSLSV